MQCNLFPFLRLLVMAGRWGALALWCWLMLHAGISFPEYARNSAAGGMMVLLPCAALFFVLLPGWSHRCGRLCSQAAFRVLPALGMLAGLLPLALPEGTAWPGLWACCLLAGTGGGVAFLKLAQRMKELAPSLCAAIMGGGLLGAWLLANLLQDVSFFTLLLLWGGAALLAGIQGGADADASSRSLPPGRGWLGLAWCACLVSGLGTGIYAAMWETFLPLLELSAGQCLVALVVTLAPALALWPAWRSGPQLLTILPFTVVAYTAWPLFHRESPALSLQSLHASYFLLVVWMLSLLVLSSGRLLHWLRHLCWGMASALMGVFLGKLLQPLISHCLMRGTTVNELFLSLALLAVVCVALWSWLWDRLTAPSGLSARLPGEEEKEIFVPQDPDVCRQVFRQLGLTPQQALIATMLAHKQSDAEICQHLSISPSTLKTHIRNILRRTGINSRHELPWLLISAHAAQQQERGMPLLGPEPSCRGRSM